MISFYGNDLSFYSSGLEMADLEGEIVLGNQLPNPLTVPNMTLAWNNLYNQKINTLESTHKYVRFLPTYEEYETLQGMDDLDLFDYPLDREIVQDGSFYHDPSVPDDEITWQYAIVDKDFVSPVSNYEVLDEIVVVDYNTHWIEEAYRIKGLDYDGTPYGYFDASKPTVPVPRGGVKDLPPRPDCPPGCVATLILNDVGPNEPLWVWYCDCGGNGGGGSSPGCGCYTSNEHRPAGAVRVWDTQHDGGRWEGVQGVKVLTWRKNVVFGAIFKARTYTDENGCWHVKQEYKKRRGGKYKPVTIGVRVKFKNKSVVIRGMSSSGPTDISGYMEPVKDTREVKGVDLRGICINYVVATTGEAEKRYTAATVMNAYYEYKTYAAEDGITDPGKLDILVHPYGGAAAAPMLDKINGNLLAELSTVYGVTTVLDDIVPPLGTLLFPVIGSSWVFAPDIAYGYGNTSSDQMKETLFHEFAHASHFQNVTNEYWGANIEYIVTNAINGNNPPYGTLGTPGAGRSGVIEMWGWHYGPTLADRLYGLEHSNPVAGSSIEAERFINLLERRRNVSAGVIPVGLFHDLIDVNPVTGGFENPAVINDVISGFTNASIFNRLNSNILSPAQLKAPLSVVAPSGVTTVQINALFGDYGF